MPIYLPKLVDGTNLTHLLYNFKTAEQSALKANRPEPSCVR